MFVFVVFDKLTCHVSVFSFFKYIMYYIIANIWVCCQTFIYFVVHFAYIIIYIVYDISKLLLPKNVKSNIIKQGGDQIIYLTIFLQLLVLLEGPRASTGLCVDGSSGVMI